MIGIAYTSRRMLIQLAHAPTYPHGLNTSLKGSLLNPTRTKVWQHSSKQAFPIITHASPYLPILGIKSSLEFCGKFNIEKTQARMYNYSENPGRVSLKMPLMTVCFLVAVVAY